MVKISYAEKRIYGVRVGQMLSKDMRRRIPPGIDAKSAAEDPTVELDLTGKGLTDDGLSVFIDDLIHCMSYRDKEHPQGTVRLTELCLKANNLTVMSMMKLSEVIFLGSTTLTKVDISNNSIRVFNEYERRALSSFLNAFRYCIVLKKVDFGGNQLENAGFDVLSCMYFKSEFDFTNANLISKILESNAEKPDSANELNIYARKRGLRSVPYLIFSNTCTTPLCAFHLWNIITAHDHPNSLLDFLPAGKSMAPPGLEGKQAGIVYSPNRGLSPLCQAFLDLGNEIRHGAGADNTAKGTGSEMETAEDRNRAATARELQRVKQIEVERVQKRIVLSAIDSYGIHSVRLWAITFKLLVAARAVLLDEKNRPHEAALWNNDEIVGPFLRTRVNYQSSLTSRMWSLNIANNFPNVLRSPGGFPSSILQRQPCSNRYKHSTNLRLKAAYRSEYRFGLPIYVWRDILAMAFDDRDILGREQQVRVVEYASDWTGIEQQIALRGARESEQIWTILSTVECLVYTFEE